MPRYLKLAPHLTLAEIQERHAAAPDAITRTHWWMLWSVALGATGEQVARRSGYSAKWIGQIVRRYNAAGPTAVGDQRRRNPGAAPLLTADQCAALAAALEGPAPAGGLWTGSQVAAWMRAQLGRPVHPQRGWEYLGRVGYTPHRPRPRHTQADAAAQAAFRKASPLRRQRSKPPIPPRRSNGGPRTSTVWG
jgi:transposase